MSFSLRLLGGVSLEGEAGPVSGPASQRHRLALLTLLAVSRPPSQRREKLMAWLWPEHDAERARALLNQAVHTLRRVLGAEAIVSAGDDLRLDPALVWCDVTAFEDALAAVDPGRAVALYTGPFLDGFFLDGAAEFQRWADRERERLQALYSGALEGLAAAAGQAGDWTGAVAWWRSRAALDHLDSRVALQLMAALEQEGNPAGALRHGLAHQQWLREELEIEPDAAVLAAVQRLRQESRPVAIASRPEAPEHAPVVADANAYSTAVLGAPQHPPLVAPRWRTASAAILVAVLVLAAGLAFRLVPGSGARAVSAPADEIAQAVAAELIRRSRGDTSQSLPPQRTVSIPAYELYLRGNDPALLRSDSAARRGLSYFERAVALDPNYAAAWAGLARMQYRTSQAEPITARATLRAKAEAAARKAVALDPTLGEAHATLGLFRTMARDFPAAETHLTRAVTLQPRRAVFREWLSNFYLLVGRREEALAEAEEAVRIDPLSPSARAELARALIASDRCEEAMTHLTRVLAVDPPLLRAAPLMAQCQGRTGNWAEAISSVRPQAERGDPLAMAFTGYMYARAGQRARADSIQSRLQERVRQGEEGAYYLAFVPAALGDRDQAFEWLSRGLEDGSLGFPSGRTVPFTDPLFDDLKGDPRLDQLRARYRTSP